MDARPSDPELPSGRRLTPPAIGALTAAAATVAVGVVLLTVRLSDGDLASSARSAAEERGTYRFEMTQRFEGPGTERLSGMSPFTLTGAVDLREGTSRLVTAINVPGIKASCTYVSTKDAVFVNVHPSRRRAFGAAWLRTDTRSLLASQGLTVRPDQVYGENAGLFDDVSENGTTTVQGVRTTRYDGTVGIKDLAPGAGHNAAFRRFEGTVPVAIFVDDDDLVRRLTFDVRSEQRFALRMTIDFFGYGDPVNVSPPEPKAVKQSSAGLTTTACFPAAVRR